MSGVDILCMSLVVLSRPLVDFPMSIVDMLVFLIKSIADLLAHGFVPIAGDLFLVYCNLSYVYSRHIM